MVTSTDLKVVFIVLYDNNPSGFKQAFANAGYSIPNDDAKAKEYILSLMYSLYFSNPEKLRIIMNDVPWNFKANNYTAINGVRDRIMNYMNENLPAPTSKIDGTTLLGILFGNHAAVITSVQSTPIANSSSGWAIAGYISLGVLAIVLIVVGIRKYRGA